MVETLSTILAKKAVLAAKKAAKAAAAGEVSYESSYHPENAEHVLALEETGKEKELTAWYAAFEKPSPAATYE